jgi:large subunit ribosomal protein L25
MKHETPTIKAERRDRLGSRYSQRLRKKGRLPGVIYGHKTDNVAVTVDHKETVGLLKHGAHVVNVAVDGAQPETCLVKDLQFGYLGDDIIHVDFARVDLNEEVEVQVHLKFVGSPEAAMKPGSVLSSPMSDIEVICKVKDIPGEIKVDISKLEEVLMVKDIQLPEGIRTNQTPDSVVAQITFVAEEVVVAPEAAEVVEGAAAEPEVITEKKPAAEEAVADEAAKKEAAKK